MEILRQNLKVLEIKIPVAEMKHTLDGLIGEWIWWIMNLWA